MSAATITTRIVSSFDDPNCREDRWTDLLRRGELDSVNLTWQWQRSWWASFGKGQLMLVMAERDGIPQAIAPLFADGGMIYNICPEDSLNFVGDISDPVVLDALLTTAREHVPGFAGFKFYFIPDTIRTGDYLRDAAGRLGMSCYDEDVLPSPYLDLAADPDEAATKLRKKSLRRHENYFRREGTLEICHAQTAEGIEPHLEGFFAQHMGRRGATDHPSLFNDPVQQQYYRRLTKDIGPTGWLRFSRLMWNGRPIAYHYGLCYEGRYLFGIPSFDIALAEHSPGEVLLRQLIMAAIEEGAQTFDFGIGDEAYKYRFATHVPRLHTWGLYPA